MLSGLSIKAIQEILKLIVTCLGSAPTSCKLCKADHEACSRAPDPMHTYLQVNESGAEDYVPILPRLWSALPEILESYG